MARRQLLGGLAAALGCSLWGAAALPSWGQAQAQVPQLDPAAPIAAASGAPVPPHDDSSPQTLFRNGNGLGNKMTPEVRERLVQLLQLPKDKLWDELLKWPAFREMTLQEQAGFLNRLGDMRQRIRNQALKKASDLGLKLTPEQEDAFINSYLQQRMEIERQIWEQTQAKRRELDEQLKANLKKQYAVDPKPAAPAAAAP